MTDFPPLPGFSPFLFYPGFSPFPGVPAFLNFTGFPPFLPAMRSGTEVGLYFFKSCDPQPARLESPLQHINRKGFPVNIFLSCGASPAELGLYGFKSCDPQHEYRFGIWVEGSPGPTSCGALPAELRFMVYLSSVVSWSD
jgi:hypothetical protein